MLQAALCRYYLNYGAMNLLISYSEQNLKRVIIEC